MIDTIIIGNLTQDAQIKDWNGQQFISFTVADNDTYTDKEGVKHEKTTYVSCLKPVFNGNAKVAQYLKKGTQVFLRGRVSSKAFVRQDGTYDSSLNLRVDYLELLSSARRDEKPQENPLPSPQTDGADDSATDHTKTPQNGNLAPKQGSTGTAIAPENKMPADNDELPF